MTAPGVGVGAVRGYLEIGGTQAARQGVFGVQEALDLTATAARRAGSAVDQGAASFQRSARSSSAAASASAKFRAAQLSQVAAQERLTTLLNDEDASLGRLASAQASVIRANERLKASSPDRALMRTADAAGVTAARTEALRASAASTVVTLGKLGVGLGVFEAARKAIDIGKEAVAYQADMTKIRALTGASAAEINRMDSALLDMAGPLGESPEKLAASLYHVEAIGLRGAKALDAETAAAKGAKIGHADLEETTNALTATIQSGIAKNQSYTASMSDLLTIVGTGDMKLSDFNDALGTGLLATLANAGVDLRDTGAAIAVFGDNNIRGANAATMLRVAVQALESPAKSGASALSLIGIKTGQLKDDLLKGGLNLAVTDLKRHLDAAGYSGKRAGGILVEAFGKKANTGIGVLIHEYDLLQQKYGMLDHGAMTFGQRWNAVTHTAAFHLAELGHEAEATGVRLAEKATPAVSEIADLLAKALPAGLHAAGAALHPFVVGWHEAGTVLGPVEHGLGDVLDLLGPLAPVLSGVATAALAMWLAFKGYEIARAAVFAVQDGVARLAATSRNGFAEMRSSFGATQAQLSTQAAVMRAEFAEIEAAALADAAATDRAAAMKALAYADMAAASKASTDVQVAAADEASAAALAQATASAEAATVAAAAATESATAIETAGAEASVGWSAVLGPIALVAVGVLAVASMFHRSETASKEAAAAAKAYTDALKSDGGRTSIVDSITKQLADAHLPENLRDLNKALGGVQFSGQQFVHAISAGGKPLDLLRSRLEGVVKAGTSFQTVSAGRGAAVIKVLSPAAEAASKALGHLNTQYTQLSKAAQKDLLDTKTFAGVSSSIDKVSQSTQVGTDVAKRYAAMTGVVVDKNGIAAVSSKSLEQAVKTVASAYGHATQTGDAFLTSLNTFAQSEATTADRAALIGATLKAANGDALNFAGQMNASAVAVHQFGSDARDAAKNAVKGGESTRTWLKSVADLKHGTIDYSKAAAAPLVNDLQAIQTAGMSAAQAMYQHARATMSGKDAADAAYKVYVGQTRGQLVDQLEKLGANSAQAKHLADRYLGMPKQVKTMIEQEGANPLITVLNKLGTQLSYLTGHPWTIKTNHVDSYEVHRSYTSGVHPGGRAAGGGAPEGLFWVGEGGHGARPELAEKHGSNLHIYSHPQAVAMARMLGIPVPGGPAAGGVPGFASGTMRPSQLANRLTFGSVASRPQSAAAVTGGAAAVVERSRPVSVRVFIGNEEIRDIARLEVLDEFDSRGYQGRMHR